MKKMYEMPKVKILKLSVKDVIVTSGVTDQGSSTTGDVVDFDEMFPNF